MKYNSSRRNSATSSSQNYDDTRSLSSDQSDISLREAEVEKLVYPIDLPQRREISDSQSVLQYLNQHDREYNEKTGNLESLPTQDILNEFDLEIEMAKAGFSHPPVAVMGNQTLDGRDAHKRYSSSGGSLSHDEDDDDQQSIATSSTSPLKVN